MTSEELAQFKGKLQKRFYALSKELGKLEEVTTEELPQNSKEAEPIKEEMERVEGEERILATELEAIRFALKRIHDQSYGTCEGCKTPISLERLEAIPWASFCMPCQSARE